MKRHIISRPARALMPTALAAYSLLYPANAETALHLMTAVLLARLLSLCSGAAFRIAAGSLVNGARLRGNFATALITSFVGGAAAVMLCTLPVPYISDVGLYISVAGALINISQLCCDRLYAAFDSFSPSLYDTIMTALTISGLIMSADAAWILPACVLPAVIAGFMLLFGLRNGISLKPGVATLKYAPLAIANNALFQCVIIGSAYLTSGSAVYAAIAFAAVALLEMCESPFRRNLAESSEITIFISICAAVASLAVCFVPELPKNAANNILFACIGVIITGVHIDLRRILAAACIIALCVYDALPLRIDPLIVTSAMCASLMALCVPELISLHRISRARHLQRRRAR